MLYKIITILKYNNHRFTHVSLLVGNGYMGYKEFFEAMKLKLLSKEDDRRQLEKAFKKFDTKNNGYLNKEQLAKALRKYGEEFTAEEEEEFFRIADANGDGKIQVEGNILLIRTFKLCQSYICICLISSVALVCISTEPFIHKIYTQQKNLTLLQ